MQGVFSVLFVRVSFDIQSASGNFRNPNETAMVDTPPSELKLDVQMMPAASAPCATFRNDPPELPSQTQVKEAKSTAAAAAAAVMDDSTCLVCLEHWNPSDRIHAFSGDSQVRIISHGEPCPACARPGVHVVMTVQQFYKISQVLSNRDTQISNLKKYIREKAWFDKYENRHPRSSMHCAIL
jgi:hypothetical protein